MRRYSILTPFKHEGVVCKSGYITLDEGTAQPYLDAGVIDAAIEETAATNSLQHPDADATRFDALSAPVREATISVHAGPNAGGGGGGNTTAPSAASAVDVKPSASAAQATIVDTPTGGDTAQADVAAPVKAATKPKAGKGKR